MYLCASYIYRFVKIICMRMHVMYIYVGDKLISTCKLHKKNIVECKVEVSSYESLIRLFISNGISLSLSLLGGGTSSCIEYTQYSTMME